MSDAISFMSRNSHRSGSARWEKGLGPHQSGCSEVSKMTHERRFLMKYDGLIMAVGENPVLSGSSVMKYDFILRPIIIVFNQTIGLVNFTNFMEGLLPFFSTGFAPGRIYGSTIFVHCSCLYVPVWVRYYHGPLVQGLQKSRGGCSVSV